MNSYRSFSILFGQYLNNHNVSISHNQRISQLLEVNHFTVNFVNCGQQLLLLFSRQIGNSGMGSRYFGLMLMPVFFLFFLDCIVLFGRNDALKTDRLAPVFHAGRKHRANEGPVIINLVVVLNDHLKLRVFYGIRIRLDMPGRLDMKVIEA